MILVQNKQAVEDDIRIDFSGAINVWNYDRRGKFPMSHCMCAVDFIVEWPKDVW